MILKKYIDGIQKKNNIFSWDLSNIQLIELPGNFGNLNVIDSLNLYNNQLRILPKNFGNIKIGGIFNLSNNQLINLPKNFGNIKIRVSLYLIELSNKLSSVYFGLDLIG